MQQEILASDLSPDEKKTSMKVIHELIDGELSSRNGAIGFMLDK